MARAFRLFPDTKPVSKVEKAEMEYTATLADYRSLLKTVEQSWISKYVKRRVTRGTDDVLDFVVVDDHGAQVAFAKREDAEAFAIAILKLEHPQFYPKQLEDPKKKPDPYGPEAHEGAVGATTGTASPLDDETVNADPTLADGMKPRRHSLMDLHRASMKQRGRVNRREARLT